MKTLRIFWNNVSTDDNSLAYLDVQCSSWEVVGALLIVYKTGKCSFWPLVQIKSFAEL